MSTSKQKEKTKEKPNKKRIPDNIFGKKIDFHVFIYNDRMSCPDIYAISKDAHMIISNPRSMKKMQ